MSRCLSCNRILNDRESVRKYSSSGDYLDLCDRCFGPVSGDIPTLEGSDFGADAEYDTEPEAGTNDNETTGHYDDGRGFRPSDEMDDWRPGPSYYDDKD